MRRTLVISEEFGLWRLETSAGASTSSPKLGIAFGNLFVAAGVSEDVAEGLHPGNLEDIFDTVIPKQEGRPDVPASTVR